jgi:hypothetical protein
LNKKEGVMPKVITVEQYFEQMKRRSKLLNLAGHKRPGAFFMLDFTKQGVEAMLRERNDPEDGLLRYAREAVKEALREWNHFNGLAVKPLDKPIGEFANTINRGRARVRVLEAECRLLNKLLDQYREQEHQEVEKVAERKKMRGGIKYKNGRPFSCDGRLLVMKDDEWIFLDDGSKLDAYLARVAEHKKARAAARRTLEQEAAMERAQQRRTMAG